MIEFINSLSIKNGALAVALICGLLSVVFSYSSLARIKWLLAFTAPFVIAYTIYWTPAWHDNTYTEVYSLWSTRFIATWYGAGTLASVLACCLIRRPRNPSAKKG